MARTSAVASSTSNERPENNGPALYEVVVVKPGPAPKPPNSKGDAASEPEWCGLWNRFGSPGQSIED